MYLVEALLFLVPFGVFALWRRARPDRPISAPLVAALLTAVGLGLAGAVWYGVSHSMQRGSAYVPARMGPDGRVEPGRAIPRP